MSVKDSKTIAHGFSYHLDYRTSLGRDQSVSPILPAAGSKCSSETPQYQEERQNNPASQSLLSILWTQLRTKGDWAFSVFIHKLWNSLPQSPPSTDIFKTHLFSLAAIVLHIVLFVCSVFVVCAVLSYDFIKIFYAFINLLISSYLGLFLFDHSSFLFDFNHQSNDPILTSLCKAPWSAFVVVKNALQKKMTWHERIPELCTSQLWHAGL